jgi:hypothetical protein
VSIFQDAHVVVFIADYIGVDAAGKINALGAGFVIAGLNQQGSTAPQSVIALVDVPGKYNGQQFALALELRDETTGQPVMLPTSPEGHLQPLRLQQAATVQIVQAPNIHLPMDSVPARIQMPVGFQDGIPLTAGHKYAWRVEIDGQTRPGWKAEFYVPGPPPPPVLGGPFGPTDIPNIANPHGPVED